MSITSAPAQEVAGSTHRRCVWTAEGVCGSVARCHVDQLGPLSNTPFASIFLGIVTPSQSRQTCLLARTVGVLRSWPPLPVSGMFLAACLSGTAPKCGTQINCEDHVHRPAARSSRTVAAVATNGGEPHGPQERWRVQTDSEILNSFELCALQCTSWTPGSKFQNGSAPSAWLLSFRT